MAFKLNYKIIGKYIPEGLPLPEDVEYISVEWRHDDGPTPIYEMRPSTHPPDIKYENKLVGRREFVPDTVSVKPGTPLSIIMQILEERRAKLALSLGVSE